MENRRILLSLVAVMALVASSAQAITIETVTVGNPGNAEDHDYHVNPINQGPNDGGRGAVAHRYEIGKYSVNNAQYAEFLNAVAVVDPHQLYDTRMGTSAYGGISRTGTSGNYTYAVTPNMGNKPATLVNFWDAARFVNWLHNGQPTGPQDASSTEDGAYTLGGVTNPDNFAVVRNVGSRWFIPDENEWYKAAFHHPASDGGDADDYWMYPTASNVQPIQALANSVGDISNPGPNVANYGKSADWNGSAFGNLTTEGSAGPLSESYYGTADQAGNAGGWYETIVLTSVNYVDQHGRGVWGGSFDSNPGNFRADHTVHHLPADRSNRTVGFRVARYAQESIFEADFDYNDQVDSNDLTDPRLGWEARYGINLGSSDFLTWQRQLGLGAPEAASSASTVPEPTAAVLWLGFFAQLGLRRRTRI